MLNYTAAMYIYIYSYNWKSFKLEVVIKKLKCKIENIFVYHKNKSKKSSVLSFLIRAAAEVILK